jgi:hypothetical protein
MQRTSSRRRCWRSAGRPSGRGADLAKASIQGVYELGHALYALDAGLHGFARGDIERVERFWTSGDMDNSSAGFVLRLRDGRRAYIDFLHWHAFEQDEDFRIDVAFLPDDQSPDPPSGDWSFDTGHLGKMLAA